MIKWLLMTSLAGSIASLCLILLKTKLSAKYGGRWYYLVCLSALLLFLVPLNININMNVNVPFLAPQSLFSETNVPARFAENTAAAAETIASEQPLPVSAETAKASLSSLSADVWIVGIWLGGFVIMLGSYFFNYFRFKRKALQGVLIDKAGGLNVLASGYVHSPMLIGFVRPQIVFPFTNMSTEDYQLALKHELIHYKQKDAWFKLFAVTVNCLHWFNPISYLALANISEACEYSVDETLSKTMKSTDKKRYSEMILHFASQASPALNSGLTQPKKLLYRRFKLILNRRGGRGQAFFGTIIAVMIAAVSLLTSAVVFAKAPQPITQFSGGITTYYAINMDLEENVLNTLGISQGNARVFWGELYVDEKGLKVDYFNRTEPYYKVGIQWMDKDDPRVAGMTRKTFSIEDRNVTVAFTEKAAAYKDDSVIKKMVTNQIAFELKSYNKDRKFDYDHAAFIDELIQRGAYVFYEILFPKQFAFWLYDMDTGIAGYKPLTAYDKKAKITDIFNKSVTVPQSVLGEDNDGTQGVQLGQAFIIKTGETLALNVHETTDITPTVSLAVIDETTGQVAYWSPGTSSGYRHIYTPGEKNANHSFKVVASGEQEDTVKVEIFTYKSGEEETKLPERDSPRIGILH
ncbi:M56 family metallopeptidase [Paenibacillus hodogayensis]|uniref:M56 family metallopeptidase n=1 Tax=Paenibacillus hodogayensis TaxID=279208 RepID=A0ABV5VY96_9BACL